MSVLLNEEKLAAEAAKVLKPLLEGAIADAQAYLRAIVGDVLNDYEVVVTFRRKA